MKKKKNVNVPTWGRREWDYSGCGALASVGKYQVLSSDALMFRSQKWTVSSSPTH